MRAPAQWRLTYDDSKPFIMTKNRVGLLRALNEYGVLRRNFLTALFPNLSYDGMKLSINALIKRDYIRIVSQQLGHSRILTLGPAGESYLRSIEAFHEHSPILVNTSRNIAHRSRPHQLMINEILISLRMGLPSNVKFLDWTQIIDTNTVIFPSSITYKGEQDEHNVKPDAFFGLEYPDNTHQFFALEADRATEPIWRETLARRTSIRKKLLGYKSVLQDGVYKKLVPNLYVLFVTVNDERMQEMKAELGRLGTHRAFCFKALTSFDDEDKDPVPTPHLATDPWERVDKDPFFMVK